MKVFQFSYFHFFNVCPTWLWLQIGNFVILPCVFFLLSISKYDNPHYKSLWSHKPITALTQIATQNSRAWHHDICDWNWMWCNMDLKYCFDLFINPVTTQHVRTWYNCWKSIVHFFLFSKNCNQQHI